MMKLLTLSKDMDVYFVDNGETWPVNTLRLRQVCHHFADNIFKCILLNENVCISIMISPKFVHKFRNDNIPAFIQMMTWRWPGDKPLPEPVMFFFTDAYMRHSASVSQWNYTVCSCYNMVNFLPYTHNMYPTTHLWEWDMGVSYEF